MTYPKYIKDDLGDLAEYLLDTPKADELDEGVFSKAACATVEKMVLDSLAARIKGFVMPEHPWTGSDPNNRWRTVSCLQKAVRFGDDEMARNAASAAYDMDKKYLMRRLGIIAIEDVGAGSLYGVLAVLAALGSQHWRQMFDERRMLCFLADLLAKAPKDRTACMLCVLADFDKEIDKEGWAKLPNEALREKVLDTSLTTTERMTAAWLMAGTKKFFGFAMPKENDRPPRALFQLMVETGMCRATLYAAAKLASRLGEGMFVALLFMDQWLRETKRVSVVSFPTPPTPKVGKLLGAAYDMHTREGKAAIGKFKKENAEELASFLEHVPAEQRDLAVYFAVFWAEGGVLARRAIYANANDTVVEAERLAFNFAGVPEPLHRPLLTWMGANVPKLNVCREKVLYARMKGK